MFELNEAFAAQSLAVIQQAGLDPARVNPNGGAIALGHPLGCTGAKLTATILRELQRRNARYGMVTMCIGGGMGAAGIWSASKTGFETKFFSFRLNRLATAVAMFSAANVLLRRQSRTGFPSRHGLFSADLS